MIIMLFKSRKTYNTSLVYEFNLEFHATVFKAVILYQEIR